MSYAVKEIFLTLQGEGAHAGRAAVFCRFSGCNLWSGREQDRAGATAGSATPISSAPTARSAAAMPGGRARRHHRRAMDRDGRQPLRGLDRRRTAAAGRYRPDRCAARARLRIAIETNGTIAPPDGHRLDLRQPEGRRGAGVTQGHELKLVYPQADAAPEDFVDLAFERFSLQPMDGPDVVENTARAIDYCLRHPQWRLSLQTHKTLGIR